jgi:hypothetical protein
VPSVRARATTLVGLVAVLSLTWAAPAAAQAPGAAEGAPGPAEGAPAVAVTPGAPVVANPAPPLVVLSYYQSQDLRRLARAVRRAGLPRNVPLYFGNYYGDGSHRGLLQRTPRVRGPRGARRAPLFPWRPSAFWVKRQVTRADARRLPSSFRGRIPSFGRLMRGSTSFRLGWGRELGRRFRDRMRIQRRQGLRLATWQFDEILSTSVGGQGRQVREWTRGVLDGLHRGRSQVGDRPQRGFVYIAREAFPLAGRAPTPELTAFWDTVDKASLRLIGEEYVPFTGDPAAAAQRYSDGQRALAAAGGARASLAARYLVGMTPGYRRRPGLGGNVRGRPRAAVNAFRDAYVRERAQNGIAGFGQYNFLGSNRTATAMTDAIRAIAEGLRAIATRGAAPPPPG